MEMKWIFHSHFLFQHFKSALKVVLSFVWWREVSSTMSIMIIIYDITDKGGDQIWFSIFFKL